MVAEQLTLIDLELFLAIPLTEFFCKNLGSVEKSPRFHEMAQRWNEVKETDRETHKEKGIKRQKA